jgi:hypothetical protein
MQSREGVQPNRGKLRNGNPPGDPSKSPRCGARTRSGGTCRAPAMWSAAARQYTRCRMHGGASTGPRTAAGLERCRRANWKTGVQSAVSIGFRREVRREARFLKKLAAVLLEIEEWAKRMLGADAPPLAAEIAREFARFDLAVQSSKRRELAAPAKNLMRVAESLGHWVTRDSEDSVEVRCMSPEELEAMIERDRKRLAQAECARVGQTAGRRGQCGSR